MKPNETQGLIYFTIEEARILYNLLADKKVAKIDTNLTKDERDKEEKEIRDSVEGEMGKRLLVIE